MAPHVRTRLSAMMFLFYFALGAWSVTLSTYLMSSPVRGGLNFTTQQVGWIYSTFAFGGMAAPIFVGLLADKLFRAERVLGVSGLLCAGLLAAAGHWCESRFPVMDQAYRAAAATEIVAGLPALEQRARLDSLAAANGPAAVEPLRHEVRLALDRVNDAPAVRRVATDTFRTLFGLMLAYCFFLQLGLTLTSVMCLRNLADPGREFSRVRMYGTVAWVLVGNLLAVLVDPVSAGVLYLAAAGSAAYGMYAFTLPATHPKVTGRTLADVFGVPALALFRDRSFAVFIGVWFVASVMNQFYGVYAHRFLTDLGIPHPERVLTVGQVVEVAIMFVIPYFDPKRRIKALVALGLFGAVLRQAAMATGSDAMAVGLGVPLHGWAFAFFNVVAATYLDRVAPIHLRASVQGIITFTSGGVGMWCGQMLAGVVVDAHRVGTSIDWPAVWVVPSVGAAVALIVFLVMFRNPVGDNDGPVLQVQGRR